MNSRQICVYGVNNNRQQTQQTMTQQQQQATTTQQADYIGPCWAIDLVLTKWQLTKTPADGPCIVPDGQQPVTPDVFLTQPRTDSDSCVTDSCVAFIDWGDPDPSPEGRRSRTWPDWRTDSDCCGQTQLIVTALGHASGQLDPADPVNLLARQPDLNDCILAWTTQPRQTAQTMTQTSNDRQTIEGQIMNIPRQTLCSKPDRPRQTQPRTQTAADSCIVAYSLDNQPWTPVEPSRQYPDAYWWDKWLIGIDVTQTVAQRTVGQQRKPSIIGHYCEPEAGQLVSRTMALLWTVVKRTRPGQPSPAMPMTGPGTAQPDGQTSPASLTDRTGRSDSNPAQPMTSRPVVDNGKYVSRLLSQLWWQRTARPAD